MWFGYLRKSEHAALAAAADVAEPTDAQKEAGNYRKGHLKVGGLHVAIETPKGGVRSGVAPDGKPWSVTMPAHYGYVKRTQGADGDHVDVALGPDSDQAEQRPVHVIDQHDPKTEVFDEHKCQIGFASKDQALAAYDKSFSDGSGPSRRKAVTSMPFDQFKTWATSGKTKEPLGKAEKYVHPYRSEDGSFTTKDKDATFKGTGTTREEHDENIELAKKHGFQVADDQHTVTTMKKRKATLVLDHGMDTFDHTINYPVDGLDAHLAKWS
jgi:hypothetical protein